MSFKKLQLGRRGEQIALDFLEKRGMHLECRNFRVRSGEIDLVMWDKQELVFVEVRTRASDHFGTPVETVVEKKRRKIIQTARKFLHDRKIPDNVCCRFDLVGVLIKSEEKPQIEYVANAFWAE